MAGAIGAEAAKALVHGSGEIAFLDVREHGQYGEGHPFLAAPCPFSRLEHVVPDLVPRKQAPVLLVDNGDGIARRAAAALDALGYRDVSWIEGGAPAWARAGYTLFRGVNLPSKTLGEILHEEWRVPHLDVDTLDAWQRDGRPLCLFDGRPASEYRKSTIPGARSLPNGELPYRFDAAVGDPSTPVVVHCAGRTRSIVGAAGLALAGVTNPIFALENGTQGWALSGRNLAHGRQPGPLPQVSETQRRLSRMRAATILERHHIALIDDGELDELTADATHTCYLFDARSQEEFSSGTFAGARHAPGVQLAQATDQWVGVRRARIVLTCDTGLRSAIAAVFLKALNYQVFVLPGADEAGGRGQEAGDALRAPPLATITAAEAVSDLPHAALVDLRGSLPYRAGHLDGARWGIRPRLEQLGLDRRRPVYLVGSPLEVDLVARDLARKGFATVRRVTGDPASWLEQGLPVIETPDTPPDGNAIDFLFFVHDRHEGNMESARRYLEWETGLVAQLDPAERAEFRIGPSPFPNS